MRKQIKIKAFIALTLLFAFFFSMAGTAYAAPSKQFYNHVLLGDSIGAGQTPYGDVTGFSYGNALQNLLAKKGVAGSYSNFAVSGMTSSMLLDQLDDSDGDLNTE